MTFKDLMKKFKEKYPEQLRFCLRDNTMRKLKDLNEEICYVCPEFLNNEGVCDPL